MTRQAYVDRNRNLVLFWSPKCGCSAISEWWYEGPADAAKKQRNVPRAQVRRWLRNHGYELQFDKIGDAGLSNSHKIAIVRHPFDRIVSAYIDKFVGRNARALDSYDQLEGFAASFWREIRGADTREAPLRYDGLTFLEFLHAIIDRISWRDGNEPALDNHWNTQVPFALDTKLPYDEVHDLTQMTAALEHLNRRYGFTFLPGVKRATNYSAFNGRFLGNISSVDLAQEKFRLSKESFDSAETRHLVQLAYDIDFRTLGYT